MDRFKHTYILDDPPRLVKLTHKNFPIGKENDKVVWWYVSLFLLLQIMQIAKEHLEDSWVPLWSSS